MRPLIALLILFASARARADGLPWRGGDIWLEAESGFWKPAKRIELQAYGKYLVDPSAGTHEVVGAFGAKFLLPKGLEITLRLGSAQSWTPAGYAPEFVVGLSSRKAFLHDRLLLTDDAEYYVGAGWKSRYHGQYAVDIAFVELLTSDDAAYVGKHLDEVLNMTKEEAAEKFNPLFLTVGLQCDQRDALVACGPHVGMRRPHSSWNGQLQYFLGFQDGNRGQSIRLLIGAGF